MFKVWTQSLLLISVLSGVLTYRAWCRPGEALMLYTVPQLADLHDAGGPLGPEMHPLAVSPTILTRVASAGSAVGFAAGAGRPQYAPRAVGPVDEPTSELYSAVE